MNYKNCPSGQFLFKLFRSLDYLLEGIRVMLSEVGQDLAIEHYIFLLKGSDQPGIGHSFFSGSGVDLDVPKLAIVGLLVFSVRESVGAGVEECFFSLALFGFAAVAEAFGLLQYTSSSLQCVYSFFDSSHWIGCR